MQVVLGTLTTLDVSPPRFSALKAEGTNENEITVTFSLNEDGAPGVSVLVPSSFGMGLHTIISTRSICIVDH